MTRGAVMDALEIALRNAGLEPPDDLRAGVRFVHAELAAMTSLIRGPRGAEAEPAAVFTVSSIFAGDAG